MNAHGIASVLDTLQVIQRLQTCRQSSVLGLKQSIVDSSSEEYSSNASDPMIWQKHAKAFRVVAIHTQLGIENGEPLFAVEYIDPHLNNLVYFEKNAYDEYLEKENEDEDELDRGVKRDRS